MTCYIVTFEVSDGAARKRVHEQLRKYSGYCPVHEACWAILSDHTAVHVRDEIAAVLGDEGRLFVVRSGTEAAWKNSYGLKHDEWLKKNL